jgi:hypothetical protein
MTPDTVGPLSRPVSVERLPPEGVDAVVEASAEEREALARDFKLPAIYALEGRYRLSGSSRRVRVAGRLKASIAQICVVTLEPFDSVVEEEVAIDFAASEDVATEDAASGASPGADGPDPIVDGRIDLGSLTAEFLALGLDPYPRKPGVAFDPPAADDDAVSPFAGLDQLRRNR